MPTALVVVARFTPLALLVSSRAASGTTAPETSVTVPATLPRLVCGRAGKARLAIVSMLVTSVIRKLLLNFVPSRCVIHAESVTLRLPMRPTLLARSFISPVTSASFPPSFILKDLQRWCSRCATSKIERVLCFAAFLSPLPTLYKNYRGRRLKIVGEPASSKWHRLDNCSYSVILNCARSDNARVHDKVAYKDVSDRCLEVMEAVDNERVVSGDSSFKNIHGDCASCTSSNPIVKHYVALSETSDVDPSAQGAEDRALGLRHGDIVVNYDGALHGPVCYLAKHTDAFGFCVHPSAIDRVMRNQIRADVCHANRLGSRSFL